MLFGGWSSAVIRLALGAAAGLISIRSKKIPSPKTGIHAWGSNAELALNMDSDCLIQGLVFTHAGAIFLGCYQGLLLGSYLVGSCHLRCSWLMGALRAWLKRQQATRAFLAVMPVTFPLIDQIARTNWTRLR